MYLYLIDEYNDVSKMDAIDHPSKLFTTDRFKAELIWFDHGYVSYNFTNKKASPFEEAFFMYKNESYLFLIAA